MLTFSIWECNIEVGRGVLILVTIESGLGDNWIREEFDGLGTCQGSKWTIVGSDLISTLVEAVGITALSAGSMDAEVDKKDLLPGGDDAYSTEKFNVGEHDVESMTTRLLIFSLFTYHNSWVTSSLNLK